ncbi:MAG: hypothetical protein JSV84_05840 [Gemmatimonadota bacterium]|nr:MAG: hypothetical protein JSV84_05840 [Gemmatimonadota bacterium]
MKNIAPNIFRQRLLIEGFYSIEMTKEVIEHYLRGVAKHLDLNTYGEPVIYSPVSGMGRGENAGFDAFVPLVDSGISAYVWTGEAFFSIVLYTCKGFDERAAVDFTSRFFTATGEVVSFSF